LKLFFLKGGHEVPSVLQGVTGRLKGEPAPEDTPIKKGKRRRTDVSTQSFGVATSEPTQQQAFPEGEWAQTSQNQGQDYGMVGQSVVQNVDPGLQMPQGN
jgi:hypothetical protein